MTSPPRRLDTLTRPEFIRSNDAAANRFTRPAPALVGLGAAETPWSDVSGNVATLARPRSSGLAVLPDPTDVFPYEAVEDWDALSPKPTHEIAVVVLTQARRPDELVRAIASVRAQQHVDLELVLVVNGAVPPQLGPCDRLIVLPENVGIPAGRNIGAAAADARLIMFLDDDAEILDPALLARVVDRFRADPRLGAMSIRLIDEEGRTQRRHVPRLGLGSAERSGPVTYFVGAACVVRSETFETVEGFDPRFFYAMEESDLAWRVMDAGWSIWYSADLRVFHPRTAPSRHEGYALLTARNRLWMAWRLLPVPLMIGYLTIWALAAVVRGAPLRQVVSGYREGASARPPRRPIRWGTVLRMTRLGRPPVV
jgi:GT2 family glycosyltransferase